MTRKICKTYIIKQVMYFGLFWDYFMQHIFKTTKVQEFGVILLCK